MCVFACPNSCFTCTYVCMRCSMCICDNCMYVNVRNVLLLLIFHRPNIFVRVISYFIMNYLSLNKASIVYLLCICCQLVYFTPQLLRHPSIGQLPYCPLTSHDIFLSPNCFYVTHCYHTFTTLSFICFIHSHRQPSLSL